MNRYDFGYSWSIAYGPAIPLVLAGVVGLVAVRRGWPRPVAVVSALVGIWAIVAMVLTQAIGLNRPMTVPTARFLPSGAGHVLDAGAGSGRAAVGVLLARRQATVTGLDIYSGYWGIDDNTPQRFLMNVRAAGAEGRADVRTGDMRQLPLGDQEYDAVVSAYAVDHLNRTGIAQALYEFGRVLRPHGQVLLMIVNPDWIAWVASPHAIAHHRRQSLTQWHAALGEAGFDVDEEGTRPVTLYVLAHKRD
jgi:SAM-dependent methyltransferase